MRGVVAAPVVWTCSLRTGMGPGVLTETLLRPLTSLGEASLEQQPAPSSLTPSPLELPPAGSRVRECHKCESPQGPPSTWLLEVSGTSAPAKCSPACTSVPSPAIWAVIPGSMVEKARGCQLCACVWPVLGQLLDLGQTAFKTCFAWNRIRAHTGSTRFTAWCPFLGTPRTVSASLPIPRHPATTPPTVGSFLVLPGHIQGLGPSVCGRPVNLEKVSHGAQSVPPAAPSWACRAL